MKQFNVIKTGLAIGTVLNANIASSPAIPLQSVIAYAIQIFFTGTPTGTFSLNVSSDPVAQATATGNYTGSITAPTHWSPLSNSSFTVAAAGSVMWNYEAIPGYNWVQIVYTDGSSGASTATITSVQVSCKGVA